MKFAFQHEHRNGGIEWERRDLKEWLTDVFEAPAIQVQPGCTKSIRSHVQKEFQLEQWSLDALLSPGFQLNVTAEKNDLAVQVQTGNIARAFYDLLKLQFLFESRRIEAAALALFTNEAAKKVGSNLASAERIINELDLFSRTITVPILIVAFE